MKCEVCNQEEATVHLTEVVNDKVTKLHLCEQCAREKSNEMQSHFGLTDLISGLMDFGPQKNVSKKEVPAAVGLKCDLCGMTYRDFQKNGKLGCGKCYDVFALNLNELLKKIHGSNRHIGKMPFTDKKQTSDQDKLNRLRQELEEFVRAEEFEKATILRDRIRELESGTGK